MTEEQKKKISEYQKNRIRKPHSEETKAKISKASKGRDMRELIKKSAEKRRGKPSHNVKKVILNKEYIYNSIKEASLKTGISNT